MVRERSRFLRSFFSANHAVNTPGGWLTPSRLSPVLAEARYDTIASFSRDNFFKLNVCLRSVIRVTSGCCGIKTCTYPVGLRWLPGRRCGRNDGGFCGQTSDPAGGHQQQAAGFRWREKRTISGKHESDGRRTRALKHWNIFLRSSGSSLDEHILMLIEANLSTAMALLLFWCFAHVSPSARSWDSGRIAALPFFVVVRSPSNVERSEVSEQEANAWLHFLTSVRTPTACALSRHLIAWLSQYPLRYRYVTRSTARYPAKTCWLPDDLKLPYRSQAWPSGHVRGFHHLPERAGSR